MRFFIFYALFITLRREGRRTPVRRVGFSAPHESAGLDLDGRAVNDDGIGRVCVGMDAVDDGLIAGGPEFAGGKPGSIDELSRNGNLAVDSQPEIPSASASCLQGGGQSEVLPNERRQASIRVEVDGDEASAGLPQGDTDVADFECFEIGGRHVLKSQSLPRFAERALAFAGEQHARTKKGLEPLRDTARSRVGMSFHGGIGVARFAGFLHYASNITRSARLRKRGGRFRLLSLAEFSAGSTRFKECLE